MTIPKPSPVDVDALLAFHRAVFGDARMNADVAAGDDQHSGDESRSSANAAGKDDDRKVDEAKDADGDALGDPGKRALDAERHAKRSAEKAAREALDRASELEAKLAEVERAQMTEQERVAAERDDLRKKFEETQAALAARDLDLMRREVAEDKGIPPRMARRLAGSTREEVEADAEQLLNDLPVEPRTKYVDPLAGSSSQGSRASMADDIAAYIAERTKKRPGLGG